MWQVCDISGVNRFYCNLKDMMDTQLESQRCKDSVRESIAQIFKGVVNYPVSGKAQAQRKERGGIQKDLKIMTNSFPYCFSSLRTGRCIESDGSP